MPRNGAVNADGDEEDEELDQPATSSELLRDHQGGHQVAGEEHGQDQAESVVALTGPPPRDRSRLRRAVPRRGR